MNVMMKCGHAANAKTSAGVSCCAICIGINPGASTPAPAPDLTGRRARCSYYGSKCKSETDSKTTLPFFEYGPNSLFDGYYCGCYGWD